MNIPKLLQQAGSYLNDGNAKSADVVLARILKKQPQHVDALNLAGLSAYHRKRYERADRLLRKVISQDPGRASAHLNLGAVLNTTNKFDEAAKHYRAALELEPNSAVAMCNLGKNFLDQNTLGEAKHWLEAALRANPDYWIALHNLGTCLQREGNTHEAIDTYRRTLEMHDNPLTLSELIVTLRQSDYFEEEYSLATKLLGMDDVGDLAISAWETLFDAFDWDGINRSTPRVLALLDDPTTRAQCKSRALLLLNSLPDLSAQQTYECHRAWAKSLPTNLVPPATNAALPTSKPRLRIGYLSPDFCEHSVGFFCQHLICGHDADRFEV
jgi:protein O-GlcNAc transferase